MNFIESPNNPKIKQWRKLHAKKYREKYKSFIVEGIHLVEEALKYREFVESIIIRDGFDLPNKWNVYDVEIFQVSNEVFQTISETETPQGVIGICKMKESLELSSSLEGTCALLVDGVQDPGNLGTILRTADCAGIHMVILGNGCVDVYNSKVIRSSQGSIFHIPLVHGDLMGWVTRLKACNIPVYGTSLHNADNFKGVQGLSSFALIVGNEGSGVREELLQLTDKNIYIPILGFAESLNVAVATGIMLYHLKQ